MQITCMTLRAAVDVLQLLLSAGLYPDGGFRVVGPYPPKPPVYFTFSEAPPAELIEQVRGISDVSIVDKESA